MSQRKGHHSESHGLLNAISAKNVHKDWCHQRENHSYVAKDKNMFFSIKIGEKIKLKDANQNQLYVSNSYIDLDYQPSFVLVSEKKSQESVGGKGWLKYFPIDGEVDL